MSGFVVRNFKIGHSLSPCIRESRQMCILGKGCKVGFCPLRAASLQILEAGTVAFFLARLPGRELNAHS